MMKVKRIPLKRKRTKVNLGQQEQKGVVMTRKKMMMMSQKAKGKSNQKPQQNTKQNNSKKKQPAKPIETLIVFCFSWLFISLQSSEFVYLQAKITSSTRKPTIHRSNKSTETWNFLSPEKTQPFLPMVAFWFVLITDLTCCKCSNWDTEKSIFSWVHPEIIISEGAQWCHSICHNWKPPKHSFSALMSHLLLRKVLKRVLHWFSRFMHIFFQELQLIFEKLRLAEGVMTIQLSSLFCFRDSFFDFFFFGSQGFGEHMASQSSPERPSETIERNSEIVQATPPLAVQPGMWTWRSFNIGCTITPPLHPQS